MRCAGGEERNGEVERREGGGRRTEGRRQKAEDGGRKAEDGAGECGKQEGGNGMAGDCRCGHPLKLVASRLAGNWPQIATDEHRSGGTDSIRWRAAGVWFFRGNRQAAGNPLDRDALGTTLPVRKTLRARALPWRPPDMTLNRRPQKPRHAQKSRESKRKSDRRSVAEHW